MKSSELRLGNLILFRGNLICLDTNYELFKSLVDISRDDKRYKPIPLTEEWLLKFGFVKKNGYGLVFLFGNLFYSVETKEYFMFQYHDLRIKIKHVHQLQNIYFALTSEELILKSEK